MRGSMWISGLLAVALVASNLWWMSKMNAAREYSASVLHSAKIAENALQQTFSAVEAASKRGADNKTIVQAAANPKSDYKNCDVSGVTWVGDVGLRFSPDGALVGATRTLCPH